MHRYRDNNDLTLNTYHVRYARLFNSISSSPKSTRRTPPPPPSNAVHTLIQPLLHCKYHGDPWQWTAIFSVYSPLTRYQGESFPLSILPIVADVVVILHGLSKNDGTHTRMLDITAPRSQRTMNRVATLWES